MTKICSIVCTGSVEHISLGIKLIWMLSENTVLTSIKMAAPIIDYRNGLFFFDCNIWRQYNRCFEMHRLFRYQILLSWKFENWKEYSLRPCKPSGVTLKKGLGSADRGSEFPWELNHRISRGEEGSQAIRELNRYGSAVIDCWIDVLFGSMHPKISIAVVILNRSFLTSNGFDHLANRMIYFFSLEKKFFLKLLFYFNARAWIFYD